MFPDHLLDAHSVKDRKTRLSAIMTPVKEIFTGGCGFGRSYFGAILAQCLLNKLMDTKRTIHKKKTEKNGAK